MILFFFSADNIAGAHVYISITKIDNKNVDLGQIRSEKKTIIDSSLVSVLYKMDSFIILVIYHVGMVGVSCTS